MELKYLFKQWWGFATALIIVPSGIEMTKNLTRKAEQSALIIVPSGIEIMNT